MNAIRKAIELIETRGTDEDRAALAAILDNEQVIDSEWGPVRQVAEMRKTGELSTNAGDLLVRYVAARVAER